LRVRRRGSRTGQVSGAAFAYAPSAVLAGAGVAAGVSSKPSRPAPSARGVRPRGGRARVLTAWCRALTGTTGSGPARRGQLVGAADPGRAVPVPSRAGAPGEAERHAVPAVSVRREARWRVFEAAVAARFEGTHPYHYDLDRSGSGIRPAHEDLRSRAPRRLCARPAQQQWDCQTTATGQRARNIAPLLTEPRTGEGRPEQRLPPRTSSEATAADPDSASTGLLRMRCTRQCTSG
jgi:hypothetical protein